MKYDREWVLVRSLQVGDIFHPPLCGGSIAEVIESIRHPEDEEANHREHYTIQYKMVEGELRHPVLIFHPLARVELLLPTVTRVELSGKEWLAGIKESLADG